jgi:hypothetical protein
VYRDDEISSENFFKDIEEDLDPWLDNRRGKDTSKKALLSVVVLGGFGSLLVMS